MDFWTATFSKLLKEVIFGTFFLDSRFQNHPDHKNVSHFQIRALNTIRHISRL